MQVNQIKAVTWEEDHIRILDQTKLPFQEIYLECRDVEAVAGAIERLSVRGAPAIGVVAAMALAMGCSKEYAASFDEFLQKLDGMSSVLLKTRPTAVSLKWALSRMRKKAVAGRTDDLDAIRNTLKHEALVIYSENIDADACIARNGQTLVPDMSTIITICNTGSLATCGSGTALGVVRAAIANGKKVFVVTCETRPLLQGSRLTAWELKKDDIAFVLITDSMAGSYMKEKGADLVIVGADRIAANGDTANKVGTYALSVLAKEHNIPFYIAAPVSTVDICAQTGHDIPIEERSPDEITCIAGKRMAPESVKVWNPAFDVVPHKYITGIITEKGIIMPPFDENIRVLVT